MVSAAGVAPRISSTFSAKPPIWDFHPANADAFRISLRNKPIEVAKYRQFPCQRNML